jgi:hypothetical protein
MFMFKTDCLWFGSQITGAVMSLQKRYQWNIHIRPLAQIDYFKNTTPLIFPVIWNDDVRFDCLKASPSNIELKFMGVCLYTDTRTVCFHFKTIKAFHLSPDKAQLLVEELANQLGGGGYGDAADIVSRLGNGVSRSSAADHSRTKINWHVLHISLMTISIIYSYIQS